ncbi:putative leader peptide [Streptomyces sp. NPDC127098]|uniref:putative leader peptide n=1 Tax=Streptomyces sp. NPDC127098 TaxID=3347137 RepID=UPI003666B9E8
MVKRSRCGPLPGAGECVPVFETGGKYLDGCPIALACSPTVSQADVLVARLHVDLRRQASAICAVGR